MSTEPGQAGAPAAFFDLDRTLMAGSSGMYWAREARRVGLISRRRLALDAWENVKFRLRGSTDEATAAVRARLSETIAGVPVRQLQRLGPRVLAGVLPRLYPQMLSLAWEHQDAGRRVYICTAASQEMAGTLAGVLGFDGAVGTRLEIVDGRYTGATVGPFSYREGKARALRDLAEREGLHLNASYAYSDSGSDLPFLSTVGHPVAVNPDAELARVARERGWEVLRFERLGRRLKIVAAGLAAAAVGSAGRSVAGARRPAARRTRAGRLAARRG